MICRSGPRTFLPLLDLLAPSLVSRRNSTFQINRQRPTSRHLHERSIGDFPLDTSNPNTLLDKLQHRISLLSAAEKLGGSYSNTEDFNQSVRCLREALKDNDISVACQYWSRLGERNLLRLMGPPHLESCSRLMAASCLAVDPKEPWPWDGETRRIMEEIAIVAAAGGAAEALNTLLMVHIKRNTPAAAVELYWRYLEVLDGKMGWDKVKCAGPGEGGHALASNLVVERTPSVAGSVRILLAVITAHATQNAFGEALQTFLRSPQRFNTYIVKEFLKDLEEFPDLQQRVEDYCRVLETANKVSQPSALARKVASLSKYPYHLERLYDSVIDGLTGPNAYLAATPAAVSPKRPVLMPDVGWVSFLSAFVKCRRLDLAGKLWDDMINLGVTPTVSIWAALFNGYDSIRAVDETLIGWKSMISQGVKPNPSVYRALISTLFNGNKPDEALERFESFKKERIVRATTPDAFTEAEVLIVYNTVLHGMLWHSRHADAATLFVQMKASGPSPDIVTYNTFLRYHGRKGDMQGITTTLKAMGEAGLVPDIFTFSTILNALLKVGRDDAPELVVGLMRKRGIEPNVTTYSAIIDQMLREGDERSVKAAFQVLGRMEQEPDAKPNQVTYTTVLAAIHRGGWSDHRAAEDCRRYIIAQMKARGMQPDRTTYNILLVACLQNTESDGLQNALKYYTEMVERNMPMSNETWYIILQGLTAREEWAIAGEMVSEMTRSDVQPKGALGKLVQLVRDRTRKKRGSGPAAYF